MKSFSEPTNSEIDAAVSLLNSSQAHAAYFFDRLENPKWLGPLKDRGFFVCPPSPQAVEGGGVRYPVWPASRYLAKVAAHSPEKVAEILRGIETENPSILRDILDAAGRMPPAIAATLAPTVCGAIKAGPPGPLFPNATGLCVQLASGGEMEAAMNLAETLFAPGRAEGEGPPDHEDRYWYVEGLKKVVPLLAMGAPHRFLPDLCQWLTTAIDARERFRPDPAWDGSDHWRPAIEEHDQNRRHGFAGTLVGLVRQGFEEAIGGDHLDLDAALAILDRYRYRVFTRLRVHLINRFAERDLELARATMMDPKRFDDSRLWLCHEYAMLMRRCFPVLLPEQQAAWLDRIDRGPDEGEFCWNAHVAGREATGDDRRAWAESWKAVRLHWIAPHLSGERRAFYERVKADWEDPERFDFHYYSPPAETGWRSPISAEELSGLTLAEALDKICARQPSKRQTDVLGEGVQGLATAFGQYVGAVAEELSGQAESLKRREPKPIYIYARTFIEQMADAIKACRKIDLPAVLRLCKWVVEQPLDMYGAYVPVGDVLWKLVDKDWQWARDAICRLVRAICDPMTAGVPGYPLAGNREAIGLLLKPLAEDPAKSHFPEEAAGKNLRVDDFLTVAINTPRGIAVEAIVAYARWVANHVKQKGERWEVVPGGFDSMPEVRERLGWQIAPQNASFEAFAVIGAYFGLLHWIDESWVRANAQRIFDLTAIEREPKSAYGWAAWNSFLDWGQVHATYYQILRPQYVYAVKHVAEAAPALNSDRTPIRHLGKHLVLLYGRGDLKTSGSDDEALLFDFLEAADSDVRSQTIAFVGSTLAQSGAVREAIVGRFQKLWERYWREFGEEDVAARPPSGLFGSWFRCEQFPIGWQLEHLAAVVRLPHIPDLAEKVVERLAKIAEAHAEHVEAATRILDRMIRVDKEGWRAYAWRESAMKILGLAIRGEQAAREVAAKLIDDLGRRGYQEFRNLLPQDGVGDNRQ
jgi:hypothetical protein